MAATKPVIITRTQYVPLDARVTAPCDNATSRDQALQTNGSLLAAYVHDAVALTACGAKVDAIRAQQPKP